MRGDLQFPPLTNNEFKSQAMPNFLEVFNLPCPFVAPFTPRMASRIVIYCEIYPHAELLDPIIEVASNMGDKGFYFAFTEDYNVDETWYLWYPGLSGKELYLKTWFIPFEKVKDYQGQTFLTNHVLYSPQGKWGLYMSTEDFLLIGGIPEFVSEIEQRIPNLDELTHQFLEDLKWRHLFLHSGIEWVPKFLDHVYGSEITQRLLDEHGLNDALQG